MDTQTIKKKLEELYARYDMRCSRGQFGLAECTLDSIRYYEGLLGKEETQTIEEKEGLIPDLSY